MGCFPSTAKPQAGTAKGRPEKESSPRRVARQVKLAVESVRELSPTRIVGALSPKSWSPSRRRRIGASLLTNTDGDDKMFSVKVDVGETTMLVPDMTRFDKVQDLRNKLATFSNLPQDTVNKVPLFCWGQPMENDAELQTYDIPWNGRLVSTEQGWKEGDFDRAMFR